MMKIWKRRNSSWKEAVLLMVGSIVVGYPSAQIFGAGMWGVSRGTGIQLLATIGFFGSLVAFGVAILIFVSIAGAAVVSLPESAASSAVRPAQVKLGERDSSGSAAPQSRTSKSRGPILALQFIVLVIVVCNIVEVIINTGGPTHPGSLFWYCVVDQIPFLVAVWRIWEGPDAVGLLLVLAASVEQTLFVLAFGQRNIEGFLNPWRQTAMLLNIVAVGCVAWIWARFRPRLRDISLLLSIFVGVAAYKVLSQVLLDPLLGRLQIPHVGR